MKGIDGPVKIMDVLDPQVPHGNYFSLPNPGDFVDDCFPDEKLQTSKRSQAFNAFIKFCDFLLDNLEQNQDDFGLDRMNDYTRREAHIRKQRTAASKMDKALSSKSQVLYAERQMEASNLLDIDNQVPKDVMEKALQAYKSSLLRKKIFEHLEKKMAPMEDGPIASGENVRDFLMVEVFISGAGCRADVVYNILAKELFFAPKSDDGKGYTIHVSTHKTASTYGPMKIFIPTRLHNLLMNFCCELYPQHFKKVQRQQAKTPEEIQEAKVIQHHERVFVTNGGKAITKFDAPMAIWKKCAGPDAFGGHNLTAIAYRKYAATKFQEDADPVTREQAPRMVGHSQKTAMKHYQLHQEVEKRQAGFRQKVLPNDPLDLDDHDDDIADPSWKPSASERAEFLEQQKQKSAEALLAKRKTLEEISWMQTPRHRLSTKQRDVVIKTFLHLSESRGTLLQEHLKEAMKKPEFASMIQELQDSQELTLEKAWDLVKSSYRAWIRTKNK